MAELNSESGGFLRTAGNLAQASYVTLRETMPRLWPVWLLWLGWHLVSGLLAPEAPEPSLASLISVWTVGGAVVGILLSAVALRVLVDVPGPLLRLDGKLARFLGATLVIDAMLMGPMIAMLSLVGKSPEEVAQAGGVAAVVFLAWPLAIWISLRLVLWPLDELAGGGLGPRGVWRIMRGRVGSYFWALAALVLPSIGLGFGLVLLSQDSRVTAGPSAVLTVLAIALELGLQASLYRAVLRGGRT